MVLTIRIPTAFAATAGRDFPARVHVGDSVMAVFEAPIAHGNEPERAVRAAIDIHRAVAKVVSEGEPLAVYIGVASGQVVAGGTGSAAHQGYTVTGDSVNLASRLQDLAAYR